MVKDCAIGVIGAGQIGSRHLQALALMDRPVIIQVVDPVSESLSIAKERFNEVKGTGAVQRVDYLGKIADMEPELDLVVVATTAGVRRQVIETLLTQKQVNYLLLEKVLFQKLDDFSAVNDLLTQNSVKTWVNFTRRMWPIIRELKERFQGASPVNFNAIGGQWGLACNGLHYVDLFAYFTGELEIRLHSDLLSPEIIPSTRPSHIELTGTLRGSSAGRNQLAITSYATGNAPFVLNITSHSARYSINENAGIVRISEAEDGWKEHEKSFTTPFQSQLTQLAAQQILDTGQCSLTGYEEAWKLHVPFIETVLAHLQRNYHLKEANTCPIT
ncbi:MAG: Gfo/Idh/MocA family protein [Candidatus Odinarchaeota archaeon]